MAKGKQKHYDGGIPPWARELRRQVTLDLINEAYPVALADLTVLSIAVLADKFGWGKELLNCYVEELAKNYESLQDGYITLQDLQNEIARDYGIFIEIDEKTRRMSLETEERND